MVKVVGIKFKTSSRVYYFDPLDLPFHVGDHAIVETSRGLEFGDVTAEPMEVEESEIVAPLKPVIRIATEEDKRLKELYAAKEPEAFAICEQKILEHELDMKLVNAEYIFNGSKIVFYFTADERVDFRDLVKDLAYSLRTRIELRQIGVRDEAKMLGGLGPCGRPVCCNAFLDDFRPVSIKMAKEQNLSLSPTKISGLCGRLMCCLQYEQNVYESMKKVMPKVGKEINTIDGVGVVVENNAITEKTKVRLTMEDGTIDVREYPYTHLGPVGEPLPEEAIETTNKKPEESSELGEMIRRENSSRRPRKPEKPAERDSKPEQKKPAESKQKQGEKKSERAEKPENPEKQNRRKPENGEKNEQRRPRPKQENKGEQPKQKQENGQKPKDNAQKPRQDNAQKPKQPRQPKPQSAEKQPAGENGETQSADPAKRNRRRRSHSKKPDAAEAPKTE